VLRHVLVDVADHRGERRGLARAGRAGHEHHAALLLRELTHDIRQAEFFERRRLERDRTQDQGHRAALSERIDAEAAEARRRVGEVGFVVVLELLDPVLGQELAHHPFGVRRHQLLAALVDRSELAVDAGEWEVADFDVNVGRALLNCVLQDVGDVAGA